MNDHSSQSLSPARSNKFEAFVALALFALGLLLLGAALDIIYRLVLTGWRAADFLFNLLFTNH